MKIMNIQTQFLSKIDMAQVLKGDFFLRLEIHAQPASLILEFAFEAKAVSRKRYKYNKTRLLVIGHIWEQKGNLYAFLIYFCFGS